MPTYDLDSATNILAEVVDQDAFKVNNGESLELAAGGAIRATGTGGYGIQTVGSTALVIKGLVESATSWAVSYRQFTSDTTTIIHLSESALLKGSLGIIGSGALTIFNSGQILATNDAIRVGGTLNLANTGTITGDILAGGGSGGGVIANAGVINGDVDWSRGGRLILDNRQGVLTGTIKLSDYRCTFYGGALAEDITIQNAADYIDGGRGDDIIRNCALGADTIIGGGGNDTAEFGDALARYDVTRKGTTDWIVAQKNNPAQNFAQLSAIRFLKFTDQTVTLHNAAPINLALSKTAFAEDTPVTGIVASLSAFDADGDALTYSLTGNPSGLFKLDGANVVLAGAVDFEALSQHSITVKAKDAYGGEVTKTFDLAVTNVVETNPLVLRGTRGADRLTGESGSDTLYGGLGKDVLTGGLGKDIFMFDTRPNKSTNLDRIVDFNVRDDTIHLAKTIFSKISKKGVLASNAFWVGNKAHDASDRIFYDKNSGALFYDEDGNGAKAAVQFATVGNKLAIKASDFYVL